MFCIRTGTYILSPDCQLCGNDEYTRSFIRDNCTFIDTNNNHGVEKTLESLGAQPYTKWGSAVTMNSGFCSYPLYEFSNNVLQDMDPKGYEQHMDIYIRLSCRRK